VLTRSDAHGILDREYEDLAVADLSGLAGLLEREDHLFRLGVGHDDLELQLGEEVDDVFRTAIELGMSLLTPESLDLTHGQSLDAALGESFLGLVEFEWFDDRFDFLNLMISVFSECLEVCRHERISARAVQVHQANQFSLIASLLDAIPAAANPPVVPSSMNPGEPDRS